MRRDTCSYCGGYPDTDTPCFVCRKPVTDPESEKPAEELPTVEELAKRIAEQMEYIGYSPGD